MIYVISIKFTVRSPRHNYFLLFLNFRSLSFFVVTLPIYSSDLTVYGLDEYENKKIQWDYIGAFPTKLAEIQWDYTENAEIASSATFEFTKVISKLI